MSETPEQLHARAVDALRMPPVAEWEEFPFDGEMRPRALLPPVAAEAPRNGEGGVDCWSCAQPDEAYIWSNACCRRSRTGCPWWCCSRRAITTPTPAICRTSSPPTSVS